MGLSLSGIFLVYTGASIARTFFIEDATFAEMSLYGYLNGGAPLALAGDMRADLIVSGGYGHSRLREWTFGGVTRALLKQTPFSRLMAN